MATTRESNVRKVWHLLQANAIQKRQRNYLRQNKRAKYLIVLFRKLPSNIKDLLSSG